MSRCCDILSVVDYSPSSLLLSCSFRQPFFFFFFLFSSLPLLSSSTPPLPVHLLETFSSFYSSHKNFNRWTSSCFRILFLKLLHRFLSFSLIPSSLPFWLSFCKRLWWKNKRQSLSRDSCEAAIRRMNSSFLSSLLDLLVSSSSGKRRRLAAFTSEWREREWCLSLLNKLRQPVSSELQMRR